jgi:hypothetical protein
VAIFNPGPIVAEVRGSIGGTTFSRNRGGTYARFRASPIQPGSSSQALAKGTLTGLVAWWKGVLTTAQREAWNVFAEQNPVQNRVGQSVNIGGLGWFNRVNAVRVRLESQFSQTLTPFIVNDPPGDGTDIGPPGLTYGVVAATGAVTVGLDLTQLALWDDQPNAIVGVWASVPAPSSRFSPKGLRGRIFAFQVGDSMTPVTSPLTLTLPVGHPRPAAGQAVFFRSWLSLPDGRVTSSTNFFRAIAS